MDKPVPELKKKESLFGSYRKYRKMFKDSFRSGAGKHEVYKPIWFAYDALDSFLTDGLTPRTINTTSSTGEPETLTVENEEGTVNENRVVAETRKQTKSTSTARSRSLQCEVKEAGKHVKEAVSLLQSSIKKRESQAFQDDCDIYALGLAKKLRAFSEEERLEIMYDIDGMILNCHRAKHPNMFTTNPFSPSQYSQCSSPMSSYSEPLSSEVLYSQNTRIACSEPLLIHVPQEQNINVKTGSNVCRTSDQPLKSGQLSNIIVQAYNTS